jgi:hypothetical protein
MELPEEANEIYIFIYEFHKCKIFKIREYSFWQVFTMIFTVHVCNSPVTMLHLPLFNIKTLNLELLEINRGMEKKRKEQKGP